MEGVFCGVILSFFLAAFPVILTSEAMSVPEFKHVLIYGSGSDNGKVVITIMGDGYTSNEQNKFIEETTTIANNITNR